MGGIASATSTCSQLRRHLSRLNIQGIVLLTGRSQTGALAKPNKAVRTRIANLVRLPLAKFSAKLAARLIGGYSILILAE